MRPLLHVLALIAFSFLLTLLTACGGGGKSPRFEESFPLPVDPGSGGTGQIPPPLPPRDPHWNPTAASYGRSALFGAFPSDLVRYGDTVFAVDADAIESAGARILAYDVSGPAPVTSSVYKGVTIHDSDLVDSQGQGVTALAPIGFGYFVNDVLVRAPDLAFALVNAGGSDSSPTLSNIVVFNPTSGALRQVLNLASLYTGGGPLFDSTGLPLPGNRFLQSGAEGMAYVPAPDGSGRLYVAMSNLVFGAPSYGSTKYPGTLQVLKVDAARPAPLSQIPSGLNTSTIVRTQGYNPVALATVLYDPGFGRLPITRLLVTVAGTTGLDAQFKLVALTPASVEAYDGLSGRFEGAFGLGLAGLSAIRPALGQDAAGHHVGFYPSSARGEIYLLRLDGLFATAVDPTQLSVLRGPLNGIPITAAQAGGPGGNITGVALAPHGRTLAVCGFGDVFAVPPQPGRLFLLSLPADVVSGSGFGANFVPGSSEFGAAPGHTLGHIVLVPNAGDRPDIYVNVSGSLDANFLGNGPASLGSLQTFGLVR